MMATVERQKLPPILVSFDEPIPHQPRPMLTLNHIRRGLDHLDYPVETVTVTELARITRLSTQTIRNDIAAGDLTAIPGRRKGEDSRKPFLVALEEARRYLRGIGILE